VPIVLVTYAQPVSSDSASSIPQLTEEHDRRIREMRAFFTKQPPVLIGLPALSSNNGGGAMLSDPQAYFLCNLLGISFGSTEQWVSPCLGEEDFYKASVNSLLTRMLKHMSQEELGLVICSPDVASQYFRKKIESCQMVRLKSTMRHGSARLVLDETVRMPPPTLPFDDVTQEVTPKERDAAMRQVEAVMAAQKSIQTGQRVADFAPSGVDMREVLPDLDQLIQQGKQVRPKPEKEHPLWFVLWVIFGLCLVGMFIVWIRINL